MISAVLPDFVEATILACKIQYPLFQLKSAPDYLSVLAQAFIGADELLTRV